MFNQLQISFSTREKKKNNSGTAGATWSKGRSRTDTTDRENRTDHEGKSALPILLPGRPFPFGNWLNSLGFSSLNCQARRSTTSVSKAKLIRCGLPLALLAIVLNLFSLALDSVNPPNPAILPSSHIFFLPIYSFIFKKTNNHRHQSTPTALADAEGVFCEDLSKFICNRFPSSMLLCAPFTHQRENSVLRSSLSSLSLLRYI